MTTIINSSEKMTTERASVLLKEAAKYGKKFLHKKLSQEESQNELDEINKAMFAANEDNALYYKPLDAVAELQLRIKQNNPDKIKEAIYMLECIAYNFKHFESLRGFLKSTNYNRETARNFYIVMENGMLISKWDEYLTYDEKLQSITMGVASNYNERKALRDEYLRAIEA